MRSRLRLAALVIPLALAAVVVPQASRAGPAAAANCANDAEVTVWTGTD